MKFKINSVDSLADAWLEVRKFFKEYKHFTLEIYTKRNLSQNALQHKWYSVIAKQTGQHKDDVKAICKLKFGLPIVIERDNEESRMMLDVLRSINWQLLSQKYGLTEYEIKLSHIKNVSMTSDFTKAEAMEYMNQIQNYYEPNGILLPTKDDLDYIN